MRIALRAGVFFGEPMDQPRLTYSLVRGSAVRDRTLTHFPMEQIVWLAR